MNAKVKIGPDHYRYRAEGGPDGVTLVCDTFVVVGQTPFYWYVVTKYVAEHAFAFGPDWLTKQRRKISKDRARLQYCYADRTQALHSFQQRKVRHLLHLEYAMATAKAAKEKVDELIAAALAPIEDTNCGTPEYYEGLNWDC
jgi:hypothetical protein